MEGYYRFRVVFRVPTDGGVRVDPARFEAQLRYPAPTPEPSAPVREWAFFREHLWRGELNAPTHTRELLGARLGVPVESAEFVALEVDPEYHDALRRAVEANLEAFRTGSADAALKNHLGNRFEVGETDSLNATDG